MFQEPDISWSTLVDLRRELHRRPEIAHREEETARIISSQLENLSPDELIRGIGGQGLAAVYRGKKEGPTVLLRCELDALPLEEKADFPHTSRNPGAAHKCGHDGHMAILTGVAKWLQQRRPERGKVVLLYQPAEEVGEGARRVIEDPLFAQIAPDLAFALHNLPGFERGQVILRRGAFASASRGLIAALSGSSSHAGHPEQGRNPAHALAQAILGLSALPTRVAGFREAALITIVGGRVGGRAFGTSPGEAELDATFRANHDAILEKLWSQAETMLEGLAQIYGLKCTLEATEDFPGTKNNDEIVELVDASARQLDIPTLHVTQPFPWSEDFGHFTKLTKGCLFGLGSGVDHPELHSPSYDFPDELIETGTRLFAKIVETLLISKSDDRFD